MSVSSPTPRANSSVDSKIGRADFVEVVGAEDVADGGFDEVPERRVGREKVAGSSGRFDHWSLVVGRSFRYSSHKPRRGKPRLYRCRVPD